MGHSGSYENFTQFINELYSCAGSPAGHNVRIDRRLRTFRSFSFFLPILLTFRHFLPLEQNVLINGPYFAALS